MKHVLLYETAADGMAKVPQLVAAHRAHWASFRADGTLLLIGPFADPRDGAMGVFATREAAEAFARADPFVTGGAVARWRILGWNEVLMPEAPATPHPKP